MGTLWIIGLITGTSNLGIDKLLSIVLKLFNLSSDSCLSYSNKIFYLLIFSKSFFNFALFYSISSFFFILYECSEVIDKLIPDDSTDYICFIDRSGSDGWVTGYLRSVISLS